MLHTLSVSPWHADIAAMLRLMEHGDDLVLLSDGVTAAIGLLESVWQQRGGESRLAELSVIFTTATRLEANFWQMGLNAAAVAQ